MSLRVLAVDTTSEYGSIAIAEGERVLEEVSMHSPEGFGHVLFEELRGLLERTGVTLADIDGFAAAAGPGSFTGVRVGLTAVKGLAEANAKPAVAVSNLQALAMFGSRPLRATVVDARRGEIYGAVYTAGLALVQDEAVMPFEKWIVSLTGLPARDLELIAGGFEPAPQPYPAIAAPRALAEAVARIAARKLELGAGQDPAALDANYVRRSDAELLWRDPLAR